MISAAQFVATGEGLLAAWLEAQIGRPLSEVLAQAQAIAAGQVVGDIVKQVTRVADLVQEISRATREQADGIGQVNVAMTQLDGVTQKNARMEQDAAAEAEALSARAQRLEDAVAVFAG
jgi:aerotaxis receptor